MPDVCLGRVFLSPLALLMTFACVMDRAHAQETPAKGQTLHVIVFGAHPDDCELKVAGVAAKWAAAGHKVKFVSVTNGDIGHYEIAGGPLAQRRTAEVKEAAKILGIETQVLDHHDGELMPTLDIRKEIIRLIRDWKADVVISPRPNDYHPDHRYTSLLVQDGAYMVTVPFMCPDTPALQKNPVYLYVPDNFQKPYPFQPDVVVEIDDVMERKLDALSVITSQFAEWLPWHDGYLELVPKDPQQARQWIKDRLRARYAALTDGFRQALTKWYGPEEAQSVKFVEAFEICEYGARPGEKELRAIFPFSAEKQ